ncbi:hypothetical protein [Saccharothrix sp. ST-888]|uniref:hypothetical protein n=1 Tax=Saccharothrix sp. ST-888 TaxID=1427391 RepID=UPI0005EC63BF|nr:hypothetical protein [Saccharothrix sp. ST-888]KJK58479.1 hypothetical protein UK12_10105 [Saccharothrix sp. ST-888]
MSTTRHLINRQRRLAASAAPSRPVRTPGAPERRAGVDPEPDVVAEPGTVAEVADAPGRRGRVRWPAVLAVLTLLLGGFAAWSAARAADLRDGSPAKNAALADAARTSEVKGTVSQAVNTLFSYNYADTARTDDAAKRLLIGQAVQQYATMLAEVRKQGPQQKMVLTTTVTNAGVVAIDGDRARLLIYADQRNTGTAQPAKSAAAAADPSKSDTGTAYSPAMFAVDVVHRDGTWKISDIDTFGR